MELDTRLILGAEKIFYPGILINLIKTDLIMGYIFDTFNILFGRIVCQRDTVFSVHQDNY